MTNCEKITIDKLEIKGKTNSSDSEINEIRCIVKSQRAITMIRVSDLAITIVRLLYGKFTTANTHRYTQTSMHFANMNIILALQRKARFALTCSCIRYLLVYGKVGSVRFEVIHYSSAIIYRTADFAFCGSVCCFRHRSFQLFAFSMQSTDTERFCFFFPLPLAVYEKHFYALQFSKSNHFDAL